MKGRTLRIGQTAVALGLWLGTAAGGCGGGDELFGTESSSTSSAAGGAGGSGGSGVAMATAVDLLLVVDNSRNMGDKQQILAQAVPAVIGSFTNPPCLDDDGVAAAEQPASPEADCPSGTDRAFEPVTDLHVAVITTSLGGHGADTCRGTTTPMENDRGYPIARDESGGEVSTYDDLGFLAWDPAQELEPPGESEVTALAGAVQSIVRGAGQLGCGFEAPLESFYRFLVEPDPYESIAIENGQAVLVGTDEVLLAQRRAFLRPDSLLGVVMLSDENDCSIRDGGQSYYAAQVTVSGGGLYHLPRAQAACETDPADPCCRSCGQSPGEGCPAPGEECESTHDQLSDHINVRCWDQKRRFGIDFLYPVDRYALGLQSATVPDRAGELVANPLFDDLEPSDDHVDVRAPELVFVASIQGVPWQDIARQRSDGTPDLRVGRDGAGRPVGGYQSAAERFENDTWSIILGDPSGYYADPADRPRDPLMRESVDPRTGSNPVTGDELAPPDAGTMANAINGHELANDSHGDLQYACIFPLPDPRDCADPAAVGCECSDGGQGNPLCQLPDGSYGTMQWRAKAYPGLRQLELVRELGEQGVLGSICPAQLGDETQGDYGYLPTVRALVEAARGRLAAP